MMLEKLKDFFVALEKANLNIKPKKCKFFQKSVTFLGHVITEEGISTSPDKVAAVEGWPVPLTRKQVRSFLGLISYYRKFIPNFSTLAKPLTNLTSLSVPFEWTQNCQEAFVKLKECLLTAPILGHPVDKGQYILDTDASDVGISGVLSQV